MEMTREQFMELMDLANSMNQEEQRYVREGFSSDEELSMYDMLFNEDLSKEEFHQILAKMLNEGKIEEVKKILTQPFLFCIFEINLVSLS